MKRFWKMTVLLGCAVAWSAGAQDADGRKGLTEEQAKQRQSVIAKYDTDGDGVLSKSEQKGLSKADKQVLAKTGGVGTARKAPKPGQDLPDKGKQGTNATRGETHQERQHQAPNGDTKKSAGAPKSDNGAQGKGGKK